ncbi:Gti1/Pac2 family-domain-containing protein [Dichomitus squalens]|uniref:Gti1/Pac2 family-domain-containing protein n=3 Tax=Dichomitus squalens TaxID=114155 RepID=A0A4Q9Q7L0_9APHY|nr:Gti1/Pac2 family-domain-containing protein [Dichomitus squalens]TBU62986.1 Gti1/Pac2 family-domain-containing protein [Dichomitus squalens]
MAMSTDTPLFEGFVDTTMDALRLIEAARRGLIPRVTRRLNDFERRTMVKSGAVFIFSVEESGIKRWTEGLAWSQSRISGNFLLYREVADRSARTSQQLADIPMYPHRAHLPEPQLSYKPRGLVKKTITVKIDGSDYHLISYYTQEDLATGLLRRPTSHPDLMAIEIPPELTRSTNFRYPPNLEEAHETVGSHGSDRDAIDHQTVHAPGMSPPSPGMSGSIPSSPIGEDSSGIPHNAFTRHAGDTSGYYYHGQTRLASLDTGITSASAQGHSSVSPLAGIPTSPRAHPYARRTTGTSPSSWQSSVHGAYDSLGTPSSAAAMYSSPAYSSHTHLTSAYDQRRDSWASHAALHHEPRGLADGGSDGSGPAVLSWSPTGSPILGQTLASAPAVAFSAAANLPAGRARDHFRVRSYPSMQWQYEHASVLPHSSQVHHHPLPYALERGATAASAGGFHRYGGGEGAHADR